MAQTLSGKTVAVLATDGVELVELTEPVKALKEAGASVEILSLKAGEFQGFDHLTPGDKVTADKAVADADASSYAGLLLPGGVANPDQLRADKDAVAFVRAFFEAGKPVAAICHAPWLLIEAGVVEGRGEIARRARRGAEHDELGARLGGDEELLAQPAEPGVVLRGVDRCAGGAVAPFARHGVDEVAAHPHPLGPQVEQVPGRRCGGHAGSLAVASVRGVPGAESPSPAAFRGMRETTARVSRQVRMQAPMTRLSPVREVKV